MEFIKLESEDVLGIRKMSEMATAIVREHFDPIIGTAQNDYMLAKFQTAEAITDQLIHGYRYYFARRNGENIGFVAFYPKGEAMYLSKFYLYKENRGRGYAHELLDFVVRNARESSCSRIELNVNKNNSACRAYDKLGFQVVRTEKNDIGCGYYMDDYVYALEI